MEPGGEQPALPQPKHKLETIPRDRSLVSASTPELAKGRRGPERETEREREGGREESRGEASGVTRVQYEIHSIHAHDIALV